MDYAEQDKALDALRHGWDDVYELGAGSDGFWARRHDGRGETLIDEDPCELDRRLRQDYGV